MKFSFTKSIVAGLLAVMAAIPAYSQKVSGTLPVLYINTENRQEITSKEYYLTADCWLDPLDTGAEPMGSASNPVLLNIRGRGNWTWEGFDKKPYKLKFDKKQALLGLKKSKHFALLAHADDELGFLRNTAGFELSRRLGLPWTPSQVPVEVVINGDYKGLYLLTENIRVDEDRVNIVEQKDNATDPEEITGGWLVEIDNYNTDPHVTVQDYNYHSGNSEIWITYKTPEALSTSQAEYLRSEMQRLNDLFCADNTSSARWEEYVDLDQLVRYYIVQEVLDDAESFHGSCYLYKDLGANEKWHFGPVWDFGNSFRRGDSRQFIYQNPPYGQAWIGQIARFPVFQKRVKEVWREFLADEYAGLEKYLGTFKSQIKHAALSDARRWPQYGNGDIDADLDNFIGMMQRRMAWLSEQWGTAYVKPEPEKRLYLRGDFNHWDTSTEFDMHDDGLYYIINVTTDSGEGRFKVADADWKDINLGSNGESLRMGVPYLLVSGTNDNIYPAEPLRNVDFIVDLTVPSLTVVPTGTAAVEGPVETARLDIRGNLVTAPGLIRVYDITGRLLLQGVDRVEVSARGLLLISTSSVTAKHLFQ